MLTLLSVGLLNPHVSWISVFDLKRQLILFKWGGKAIDKMLKMCLEGLIYLIPEFLISMHYFMWLPMGAEMARQFCLWLGAEVMKYRSSNRSNRNSEELFFLFPKEK